jgi:RNA-binding protein YlmH
VKKYPDCLPHYEHDRSIAVSNIQKEFRHDQMSDKYLVKALGILGLTEQEITVVVNE